MAKKKSTEQPTATQIKEWKEKAERWDRLGEQIDSCYFNEDGSEREDDEPGLDVIGEYAAAAYGYLGY